MKFKRYIAAFCSSALVFGLSFLLFPQTNAAKISTITDSSPSITTPVPTATLAPDTSEDVSPEAPVTTTPDQSVSLATSTPAPVTTQAPSNLELLTDDILDTPDVAIKDLVINYINAYYKNDYTTASSLVTHPDSLDASLMEKAAKNISKVDSIELYSNPGINSIHSIIYVSFSLYYNDIQMYVPQFSEYYIVKQSDGSFRIHNTVLSLEENEVFLQARKTDVVQRIAISSLIRRYHTACLVVNEPLLKQCVTDIDYLNFNFISSRYSVTEGFTDYNFVFYPGINEFDYIIFVTHKEKIVLSDTPAPCMEYYFVDVSDMSGRPFVYLGITSLDTDAYCAAVIQSEEIQELAKQVDLDMQEVLRNDVDLKDFYQLLVSNSPKEE